MWLFFKKCAMSFLHSFCQNFIVYYGFATSFNTHSKKLEPLLSLVLITVTCYKFEPMVRGENFDASRFFVGELILWCYCLLFTIETFMIYTLVIVSLLPPLSFNPYLELCIHILQSKCFF